MAAWRSAALCGCRTTADMSPTLAKVAGAIQRQVSQSMHVWSTKKGPGLFSGRGARRASLSWRRPPWARAASRWRRRGPAGGRRGPAAGGGFEAVAEIIVAAQRATGGTTLQRGRE